MPCMRRIFLDSIRHRSVERYEPFAMPFGSARMSLSEVVPSDTTSILTPSTVDPRSRFDVRGDSRSPSAATAHSESSQYCACE